MRARCWTSSVELGIVKKSGAWFTYEGEQLGQGRENAKVFLAENPEIMVEIRAVVGRPARCHVQQAARLEQPVTRP